MRQRRDRVEMAQERAEPVVRSPLDLLRLKAGASRRVQEGGRPPPDSMLAVLGDRATYTFIQDDNVASIHFDRRRGEIFYSGHNIRHLELSEGQRLALMRMEEVLKGDSRAKALLGDYSATLARCLADK